MKNMAKDIKDYTEVELKALAYDELAKIEMAQLNLRAINTEIAKRQPTSEPTELKDIGDASNMTP